MPRSNIKRRRVMAWVYDAEAYRTAFEPIRTKYPDHELEIRSLRSLGEDSMAALVRELQAPWTPLCVFPQACRGMNALLRRGWLRAIDTAIPLRARNHFAPAALDLCSRDGSLYAVPEDVIPYSLLVRMDTLQRQRFQPPASWDELERQLTWFASRECGPVLRVQEGGPTHRYAFFVSLLGSNGVDCTNGLEHVAQDRAKLIESYEWARRMIGNRLLNYPADLYPEKAASMDQFRDGRFAYVMGWPSELRKWPVSLASKVRVCPFPHGPSSNSVVAAMNGSGWCVPHNTASLDIAFEMLEALSAPGLVRKLELAGGTAFPAQKDLWSDRELLARKPFYRDAALATKVARAYAPDFYDPDLRRLEETFYRSLSEGVSGDAWLKRLTVESHKLALRSVPDEIVRQAMSYIEENLAEIGSVTQVAGFVKRNPDYVNRLFQRELKQSCRTYLARRRIERAREMLSDVTLSFKEIAARIGVGRATSFSRLCQQHWGCSAVQMRKRELARIRGEPPR